jgi:hypothetical protein
MPNEVTDKHQLAGLDSRERGFSRPVELTRCDDGFRAILRYEAVLLSSDPHDTQDAALLNLVEMLYTAGFRQLKTQMSFRSGIYLGSQELWVEYPDPQQQAFNQPGLLAKFKNWLRRCRQEPDR